VSGRSRDVIGDQAEGEELEELEIKVDDYADRRSERAALPHS
jgi:hypothetical protein